MSESNLNREIVNLKAEVFDLIAKQSVLQQQFNELEVLKSNKLKVIAEMVKASADPVPNISVTRE